MRFWRFNAVGVLGFAVQLAVLALLVHGGVHYLAATAIAVEAAILHNFLWHERWTWADRPGRGRARAGRLLREAGYRAVGFDISADQLRYARSRLAAAVRADARRLPVPDACADVATGMYFQTDTEDFAAVVCEVARCLRPGGRFAYLGVHPCYVGPFVYRLDEQRDQSLTFTPGYGTAGSGPGGWADRGSGDGSKIGGRVGFHHKTLASFLQAFGDAGFIIRAVREFVPPGRILPWDLALLAEKPVSTAR